MPSLVLLRKNRLYNGILKFASPAFVIDIMFSIKP